MFSEAFIMIVFAVEPLEEISSPIPENKLSTAKGRSEHVLEEDCA